MALPHLPTFLTVHLDEIPTPALVVDVDRLDANIARMGAAWPGTTLRPHVKAFKSTALARRLADAGHVAFCGATVRELAGLAEQLGYRRVRLETGYAQPEALAMYRRLGFAEIDSFGPYEGATAFELDLATQARKPRH